MDGMTSIVLAGVGGQGSVLAGRMIARAAALKGLRVTSSEVHGMAQRGGSVISSVRFGNAECSPVVPDGEGDYLVAFEPLEAVRSLHWLRPGGVVIVNTQEISPSIEALKSAPYPRGCETLLRQRAAQVLAVSATDVAARLGSAKMTSSVMVGALSAYLDIANESWERAVTELTPPQTTDCNRTAFLHGQLLARSESMTAEAASAGVRC